MAKNKDGKKKKKLGLKGAIIAMIVAILSLLGFGWNGVDWGEGNVGDLDQPGQVESEIESEAQLEESSDVDSEDDLTAEDENVSLALYVYEDKVYTDQALTEEISLVEVEGLIEVYEGKEVFLYDSGAVKQTYEEVEKVIDIYVDSRGLIKIKSTTN